MADETPAALINGVAADPRSGTIAPLDRGFQYGDGVFETLAAVGGEGRDVDAHLARLARGAQLLGIPEPDSDRIREELYRLAPEQGRAVLKVLYTRGIGGRGLAPPAEAAPTRVVLRLPWPDQPPEWWQEGVRAITCHTRQVSGEALDGRIKHMNRLGQIRARMEWTDPGIAEGLLRDDAGWMVEGTVTNILRVRDGRLETPAMGSAGLAGITRDRILTLARERGTPTVTKPLTRSDLFDADELGLTNSLVGLWPVRELDGEPFAAPGPVLGALQQALEASYG